MFQLCTVRRLVSGNLDCPFCRATIDNFPLDQLETVKERMAEEFRQISLDEQEGNRQRDANWIEIMCQERNWLRQKRQWFNLKRRLQLLLFDAVMGATGVIKRPSPTWDHAITDFVGAATTDEYDRLVEFVK